MLFSLRSCHGTNRHWHSNRVHVLLHMRLYHVQSFSYWHLNPLLKAGTTAILVIFHDPKHIIFLIYMHWETHRPIFVKLKKNKIIWDYNPFKESTKEVSNFGNLFICLFNSFRFSLNRIYCHAICKTYCWRAENCTKMPFMYWTSHFVIFFLDWGNN
jgi:hypothetical protein